MDNMELSKYIKSESVAVSYTHLDVYKRQVITIKRYTIMKTKMSDKEKGSLITQIMVEMKSAAILQNKPFGE